MRNRILLSAFASCLVAACNGAPVVAGASQSLLQEPSDPDHSADYGSPTGADYHGGPIMNGDNKVALLFYGTDYDGADAQARRALFSDFVTGLDGSPLAQTLATFSDGSGHRPTGRFALDAAPGVWQTKNLGTQLGTGEFEDLILGYIEARHPASTLVSDPHTLYIIVTDAKTTASADSDFCHPACGWHNHISDSGTTASGQPFNINARYAFIGDPGFCADHGSTACAGVAPSPNNDPAGDRMVGVAWHELAEAVTDPEPFSGYNTEIGDLCEGALALTTSSSLPIGYAQLDVNYMAPVFGSTNGETASANVHLGSRDFRMQGIWQNVQGGGCVRRVALNRPAPSATSKTVTGSFDGDQTGDLLYQNTKSGEVFFRSLGASGSAGPPTHLGTASTGWFIYGVADFDGDRKTDILWRDQYNGVLSIWNWSGSPVHISLGNTEPEWGVRAVGDFDGDGAADILFLDMLTNETKVWLNDGSMPLFLSIGSLPSTSFTLSSDDNADVVGTGDFNHDGRADILWRSVDLSTNTSTFSFWSMNGTFNPPVPALILDHDDQVLGTGTLGFGTGVVFAVNNGNVVVADLAAGTQTVVHATPTNEWRYAGSSVVPGVGPCLFWVNRATGAVRRWILDWNGQFVSSTKVVSSDEVNDQLVAY